MIKFLKGLRLISVIGTVMSTALLLFNLIVIFIVKNLEIILSQTWMLFFICSIITLLAATLGYLFHNKRLRA